MTAPLPTRVAVVGAGSFADEHLDGYRDTAGVEVAAIVDRDADRARRAAVRAGGLPWSTDLDEVLGDETITAVDVCTPNDSHATVAVAALRRGRHVLVEKPPALTVEQFDAMVAQAFASGVTLSVGLVLRHTPWAVRLRAEADRIGPVYVVRLSIQSGHSWPGGSRAWQRDRTVSGGHIVHNGMHLLDLAGWFLDAVPAVVNARTWSPLPGGDDHWTLTATFPPDRLAVIEYSYALPDPEDLVVEALLVGSGGAVRWSSWDAPVLHTGRGPRNLFDFRGQSMRSQLDTFIARAQGRAPAQDHTVTRHLLAAVLAGRESADNLHPRAVAEVLAHA